MSNKVVIVTGGSSGLGLSTSKLLLGSGYCVSIWDRISVLPVGPSCLFCEVDVTKTSSIESALSKTLSKFSKVDALVNCAGISIALQTITSKSMHDIFSFEAVLNVNVIGLFDVSRQVAKVMRNGVIINVASVAAEGGSRGQVAYSASKGAVAGLTLPMARDLAAYNIRVVCICPGLFSTPMGDLVDTNAKNKIIKGITLGRLGNADEFAHTVKFIIENGYINGSLVHLEGGYASPNI